MTGTEGGQHLRLGRLGENLAGWYLRLHGYRLLGRNVRLPTGEIDLVAVQGEILVFCEVKTRRHRGCGTAAEAVDERKQLRLARLAEEYLQRHPAFRESACRFDVVVVYREGLFWRVEVIADAFRPGW
ncbi:MAG: YraN family protein [Magnetococcales bacterium]|nr:YraN family protein [Magnetococcales bacterium]